MTYCSFSKWSLPFLEPCRGLGDVAGDRRFLGNDEGLGHEGMQSNSVTVGLQVERQFARCSQDAAVTLWLAQLNEIFSGQLFDQTFQFEP